LTPHPHRAYEDPVRETLRQLVELQRLDDELHRISENREALPAEREASQQQLEAARQRLADAEAQLDARQLDLRQAETALQDAEELRKRLEAQQSQVKTNEAYTALLHEIEAANGAISQAETRILEGMDVTQESGTLLEAARSEVAQLERDTAARLQELEQRAERLAGEQRQTEAARADLTGEIAPSALQKYTRVAERKRPAMALVENEVCMGCRVGISPQLYVDVIEGKDLIACRTCKRLLILPRVLE
jgi:predicted  nucleic acid-binding Zn-ribbon protein